MKCKYSGFILTCIWITLVLLLVTSCTPVTSADCVHLLKKSFDYPVCKDSTKNFELQYSHFFVENKFGLVYEIFDYVIDDSLIVSDTSFIHIVPEYYSTDLPDSVLLICNYELKVPLSVIRPPTQNECNE